MTLDRFLSTLPDGLLQVGPELADPTDQSAAVRLAVFDQQARAEGPDELPAFDVEAATWAARRLHDACALYIHRDLGPEQVDRAFASNPPGPAGEPAIVWSVDLTLRHLPAVLRLARKRASADPLVHRLSRLACRFPLSSVGSDALLPDGAPPLDHAAICAHPALRTLLIQRIVDSGDTQRARDPAVAAVLRAAAGAHPELLGACADIVFPPGASPTATAHQP